MINNYYYQPLKETPPEDDDRHRRQQEQKKSFKKRLLVLLFILILLLAATLMAAYFYIRYLPLANEEGRTNIAIIGIDDTAKLGDTLMVVSIDNSDPDDPKAAMISVPRDMYVPIPEVGSSHKINAAYSFGENMDYPGGGAGLTTATLEEALGIPIHYYATLSFSGFEEIIDTLGGVTIDVKRSIDDPFYPAPGYAGYDPFAISTGIHTLDGETALKYVRSRQTTNDYDRAFRQQQVVLAVKSKVTNTELLLDREAVGELIAVVDKNVDTNFSKLDFVKLASIVRLLDSDDVPQYVIDTSNLLVGTANETGSALVPRAGDFSEIHHFVQNIFKQTEVEKFEQLQF